MSDLWSDEIGFGDGGPVDEDEWDEGEESIGLSLEDGPDDPDEEPENGALDDEDEA